MVIHRRRSAELGQASQTDSLRPVSVGRALHRLACLAIGTGDRPTENRHRTVPETIPAPADDPIRRTPAAARRLSAKAETTRTDLIGSIFSGSVCLDFGEAGAPAALRTSRHSRPVAAGALPEVLGSSVQSGPPTRRQTRNRRDTPAQASSSLTRTVWPYILELT